MTGKVLTSSARTVPRAMPGCAFQTDIVLLVMVLEGQMRNLNKEDAAHD